MTLLDWAVAGTHLAAGLGAAGHALLYKRDPRAALGWIAVSLVFPFIGPLLYFLFGINRIHTRARALDRRTGSRRRLGYERAVDLEVQPGDRVPVGKLRRLSALERVSTAVSGRPLTTGGRIEMLRDGEEAYPAMLAAIEAARQRLYLSTYIFESNATGRRFVAALGDAVERGVDVRVLLDGVGEWYSWPRVSRLLLRRQVPVALFLPPRLLPPSLHINLRNHRKILVADGLEAFTGGMNIGDRHLARATHNPDRVQDLHFRLQGPVVADIEAVFLDDWGFVTGSREPLPTPVARPLGEVVCRCLVDGPNEDLERLAMVLVGAVAAARRRIWIVTPYFLPARELVAALQVAALRGVEVNVILPARNNLPPVHWATRNMLWELLLRGVKVYYQPPPFAHTKLFVVDGEYAQIGSANVDPRSLRLNFELTVEVYDAPFAARLERYCRALRRRSREVSLAEMDARPLPARTRDALAWLFSPYL